MLKEEEKQIGGQVVIRTYYECPECGAQYNICYDSPATLTLKKQIRKHTESLKTIRDANKYWKELKDIKKKQKRLEREMGILKTKYEKEFLEEKEN